MSQRLHFVGKPFTHFWLSEYQKKKEKRSLTLLVQSAIEIVAKIRVPIDAIYERIRKKIV